MFLNATHPQGTTSESFYFLEVISRSLDVWWAGSNCSVTLFLSITMEKSAINERTNKHGDLHCCPGRGINQTVTINQKFLLRKRIFFVGDFTDLWGDYLRWNAFSKSTYLTETSQWKHESTFVIFLSPAQQTMKNVGFSRCGAEHSVIVTVSGATRELHPVRKEGFDTRRSRYSKFMRSQRTRRRVRKPHEYRDKRRDAVVNHVFFMAGSGGPVAEVPPDSSYSS